MDNCLISIIIPFYNNNKTVRHALQSALIQRLSGETGSSDDIISGCEKRDMAEILIVDASGSFSDKLTDGLDNPYGYTIRMIRGDKKLDAADARNLGVKESKGRYIAFLDSDDWWQKDKLLTQLKIFEEADEEPGLVFTARRLCDENGRKTDKVITAPGRVTFKNLLRSNYISCSSVVMKRSMAEKYPMKSGDIHEDYLCWLQMFKDGGYAAGINKPFLNYRSYRSSRSGKKFSSALMTYRTYKAAGFGFMRRLGCMVSYTVNGFRKYI